MFDLTERSPIATAAISVVLPVLDGADTIADSIAGWNAVLKSLKRDYEILLVDDGNGENVSGKMSELIQADPAIRVLRHDSPRGVGAALQTGIDAAQHPLLCTCSADGQYEPKELPRLLDKIDQVDLVCGIRMYQVPPQWYRVTSWFYRLFCAAVLGITLEPRKSWLGWSGAGRRFLARWVFGVRLEDVDCAFRLFRRELFQRIPIQSKGAFAGIEILAKANFVNGFMFEVPVSYRPALTRRDKIRWREIQRLLNNPDFGPVRPGETVAAEEPAVLEDQAASLITGDAPKEPPLSP
jgi:glycosyltransferase involved in cell wall biosynthesis